MLSDQGLEDGAGDERGVETAVAAYAYHLAEFPRHASFAVETDRDVHGRVGRDGVVGVLHAGATAVAPDVEE